MTAGKRGTSATAEPTRDERPDRFRTTSGLTVDPVSTVRKSFRRTGTPVAVAEVQPTQFGTVGISRFRAAPGHDAEGLRAQLIDFAGGASNVGRSSYRPLAA